MKFGKNLALQYIRTKFRVLSSLSKKKAAKAALELFITPQSRNKKPLPAIFQKSEKLKFLFQKTNLTGYRWNPTGKKKILILHGYESSATNFAVYIDPLLKKEYQIMAFDAPAHGRSAGNMINALDYKNMVIELSKQYGPFSAFITHSFGGLALSLALEEMHHDENTKVVFIAPATESTTAMDNFFKLLKLDADVRKEFDDIITSANNKLPSWYSVSRAAANIKAQVLFLQDKDDHLTPLVDVVPIMNKQYPNFRFIISEGLGHRKIYRDAKSVKAIIDFL